MKKTTVFYWIFTGLFAALMLGSAIPDVMSSPVAVEGFARMGLPAYLVPFIGVAKVLGVIAILVPGYPRIREWAFAGLMIDLAGATYCIAATVGATAALSMALPLALGVLAYIFHQRRQSVGQPGAAAHTSRGVSLA